MQEAQTRSDSEINLLEQRSTQDDMYTSEQQYVIGSVYALDIIGSKLAIYVDIVVNNNMLNFKLV